MPARAALARTAAAGRADDHQSEFESVHRLQQVEGLQQDVLALVREQLRDGEHVRHSDVLVKPVVRRTCDRPGDWARALRESHGRRSSRLRPDLRH